MTDLTERARLIVEILDKIMPIPENAPSEVREGIDIERQLLVMRAGWLEMPVEELQRILEEQ